MPIVKSTLSLIIALCVVLCLGVAQAMSEEGEPAAPKKQTYTSKEFGFTFENTNFPETTGFQQITVVQSVAKEADDGFTANVNVVVQMQKVTDTSFLAANKQELKAMGWELIEGKTTEHAGKPAVWCEFKGKLGDDDLYWVQLAVICDDRVFLITGTMGADAKEKRYEAITAAVKSFNLLQ